MDKAKIASTRCWICSARCTNLCTGSGSVSSQAPKRTKYCQGYQRCESVEILDQDWRLAARYEPRKIATKPNKTGNDRTSPAFLSWQLLFTDIALRCYGASLGLSWLRTVPSCPHMRLASTRRIGFAWEQRNKTLQTRGLSSVDEVQLTALLRDVEEEASLDFQYLTRK